MKLQLSQQAPLFFTADVNGYPIDLKALRGRQVYLSFERNAGCPVCNLRTHHLLSHADYFSGRNVEVIMVYESTAQTMQDYLGATIYPFRFVADPTNELYEKYGVERSMAKVMKSLFHGIVVKALAGKKLFSKPMKQDGHTDRIPAEFVIDCNGKISIAHYGSYIGDHLEFAELKAALEQHQERLA